ncbi:MAG: hypothetical protein EOP43_06390 [Sphingobacteriaceae bacterium]|nr:MAG: hypothetical protein EOP43_06390 [Sphingobacteriaceae bacterium]
MKKLFLLIILSGAVFGLKAQQNPTLKPLEKFKFPNPYPLVDTNLKINPKQKNDVSSLFAPKNATAPNNLIASLDRMPIIKPVGKWNMPVVHPDGTVVYTMPIKRLPPIIKPENEYQNSNP